MGKIIKLDRKISSKIAAGEVIENPSAVIKELVENAIDAESTHITVEVKNAGKSYIRVTDNGIGIEEEDVLIAFHRHATSKIKTVEDIYAINTLGFRGEALASIAAVSRLELITKTPDESMGTRVNINGGECVKKEGTGTQQGTTIIVNDLFYNTPARIKFLEKNSTEQRRINTLVNCLALSNPNISFKYIVNNQIKFVTPGKGQLKNVILSIYGKNIAKNMIPLNNTLDGVQLSGYISNLNLTRGNSSLQIFFVNGRYIKSDLIKDSIKTAYRTLIPINTSPICFLNIQINSKDIDVNIDPSKTTIKFTKKGIVKQLIYTTIKSELFKYDQSPKVNLEDEIFNKVIKEETVSNSQPTYKEKLSAFNEKKNSQNNIDVHETEVTNPKSTNKSYIVNPFTSRNTTSNTDEEKKENISVDRQIKLDAFDLDIDEAIIKDPVKNLNTGESIYDHLRVIGQLFNTYILCEKDESLYLLDQHAAHEKVLYEKLMDEFMSKEVDSQMLMAPIQLNLGYDDVERILEQKEVLESLGIYIDGFGKNTILIREVPILFNQPLDAGNVKNIVLNFNEQIKNTYETGIESIIQKSCKHAIKASDALKKLEIDALIDQLKSLESPYTCPHGRPIIISMSKFEIEKKFKRK